MKIASISILMLALLALSCKPENPDPDPELRYTSGAFIVNEGLFLSGNASVTYLDRATQEVTEDIFLKANDRGVGDVLQSMSLFGSRAYLIVNNSGKVEVVNADDFKSIATISGFDGPRFFLPVSPTTGYVSDWFSNSVKIINLDSNTISGSISVGAGPEEMAFANNLVFVANSGGYGIDSTISVINPQTGNVFSTLSVNKGPAGMVKDLNGNLWVICRGDYGDFSDPNDDVAGSLIRIDPSEMSMDRAFNFGQNDHPSRIAISPDGSTIWWINNGLWRMNINDTQLPSAPVSDHFFYGIGIDPLTGVAYCADPVDFTQKGWVFRFSVNGYPIDSFRVEYVPNGFVFR